MQVIDQEKVVKVQTRKGVKIGRIVAYLGFHLYRVRFQDLSAKTVHASKVTESDAWLV